MTAMYFLCNVSKHHSVLELHPSEPASVFVMMMRATLIRVPPLVHWLEALLALLGSPMGLETLLACFWAKLPWYAN